MNAQPFIHLMLAQAAGNAATNNVLSGLRWPPSKEQMVDWTTRFGPKLLGAIIIFVVGMLVARSVGKLVMRGLNKRDMEPPVRMLLVRLVKLVIMLLTLLIVADNLQIRLLPLIAGLGVVGVGVGLAMQGVLSNLVAGLTIIFVRSFRVGEYIEIAGVHGQVENIELFSTILIHPDLSRVVVPNRKIVGEIVHNYGKIRQANLSVGVAYDTDLDRALDVIRGVLAANPRVLKDPAPVIGTSTLADSSIVIAIKPWSALGDFVPMQAEINQAVVEKFRANKIHVPFPQQEIRLLPGSEIKSAA